jgi:hypothetical protein
LVTFSTGYKIAPGLLTRAEYRHDESNAISVLRQLAGGVAGAGAVYPLGAGQPITKMLARTPSRAQRSIRSDRI